MKKKWKKPIITVLVRTRPEESVMAACKIADNTVGPVPNDCHHATLPPPDYCVDYSAS